MLERNLISLQNSTTTSLMLFFSSHAILHFFELGLVFCIFSLTTSVLFNCYKCFAVAQCCRQKLCNIPKVHNTVAHLNTVQSNLCEFTLSPLYKPS